MHSKHKNESSESRYSCHYIFWPPVFLFVLTSIAHGSENVFCHVHDCVSGLVVAPDGLSAAGVVADVLQQVAEGLAHHAGCCTDLLQQLAVVAGRTASLDTGFHGAVHQLPGLDKLLLTHWGADGWAHHLHRTQLLTETQTSYKS